MAAVFVTVCAILGLKNAHQDRTPYVDALRRASARVRAPFFLPGHKAGAGVPPVAADVLGTAARFDLPELPELDSLFAPSGPLAEAQELAAEAFGAKHTWFLANGSSAGVIAAIIAAVRVAGPGRSLVVLQRTAHRSAVHGLIHAGAEPVWLPPERDPSGVLVGVDPTATLREALAAHGTRAAAVLIVSPSYEGAVADVRGCADICRAAGVPLIVDEAHGAHLGLARGLPPGALSQGADIVVQSTHKTLGALAQAAMLHLGSSAPADLGSALHAAISAALETVTSSSPSSLLLASLDAARHEVASPRPRDPPGLRRALRLAGAARARVAAAPDAYPRLVSLRVPSGGCVAVDPLRLTVDVAALGGGYAVDDFLIEECGVYCELPTLGQLTFVFGPGTTPAHTRALLDGLRDAKARLTEPPRPQEATSDSIAGESGAAAAAAAGAVEPRGSRDSVDSAVLAQACAIAQGRRPVLSPRKASLARTAAVALDKAVGCVSGEVVCVYPPGIPLLYPGELVTTDVVEVLKAVRAASGEISAADPEIGTLRVVTEFADDAAPRQYPLCKQRRT